MTTQIDVTCVACKGEFHLAGQCARISISLKVPSRIGTEFLQWFKVHEACESGFEVRIPATDKIEFVIEESE